MMSFSEKLYRIGEASSLLGVHPNTIRRWEKEGKIKIVRVGRGHRRIPESEILRLMREEPQISAEKDYESALRSFLDFVFKYCKDDRELLTKAILIRDGHKCRVCGSSENLSVREKSPEAGPTEENLITICGKCAGFGEIKDKKEPFAEKIEKITKQKILNELAPSSLAQRVAFGEILSASLVLRRFSLKELVIQSKSPEPVAKAFCERMEALGYLRKEGDLYEVAVEVVE